MTVRKTDLLEDRAEGRCLGHPYNTELASINGVSIHFWLGATDPTPELLARLEQVARRHRDIVRLTYSHGEPAGFWANQDIN